MRFSTFATSCVAIASTCSSITLAASLQGPAHQDRYVTNSLAQSQLNTEADAEADAELFEFVTEIYEHFVPPSTEFFDLKEGDLGTKDKPAPQDMLQVAMEDVLYEVGSKQVLWSSKKNLSQHGWPHDYCNYEKYQSAEVEVIVSGLRQSLNVLHKVLQTYELGPVDALKEADLQKKGTKPEEYVSLFDASIKQLQSQVDAGSSLLQRDSDENDKAARKKKFDEVLLAARNMEGLHRGRLAVSNAWARKLITDSCQRQGKDAADLFGVLYQGALNAIPNALGSLTKTLGGDEQTANTVSGIADMITKVTGMGTPEDQTKAMEKLAEATNIDAGILSALATTDPQAIQKAAEQFGDKKLSEAIYKVQSAPVLHEIQNFDMDSIVKEGAEKLKAEQTPQKPSQKAQVSSAVHQHKGTHRPVHAKN